MKIKSLFLVLILSMVFFNCKKEEVEPTSINTTTIIEGRIINQLTQLPITDLQVFLSEDFLWNDVVLQQREQIKTDENGEFEFNYTSDHSYSNSLNVLAYDMLGDYDDGNVTINGVQSNCQSFVNYGCYLVKGHNYIIEVELTPK